MADQLVDDVKAALGGPQPAANDAAAVRQVLGMPAPSAQPSALGAGLRAGMREVGGLTGAAAAATGKLTGLEGLEQWGTQTAQEQFAKAREVGRPDLEVAPWREGGGGLSAALPWLGYQAAKQVPQMAAGVAAGMLVPEAAVPAGLARLGAALPEFMGGGAIGAAEGFAAKKAAVEAGRGLAKQAVGQEIAGLPPAVGSMYQEAMERPGGPTKEDAQKAFGLAPFYSALDAASPAIEVSRLAKGVTGNLAKRVATGIATDAIMEMPQEAAQTAMELSFRPDMSTKDKASQIVDAAITGGAVGGVFGGVSSIRGTKNIDPAKFDTSAVLNTVDKELGLIAPAPVAAPAAKPAEVTGTVEAAAPPMMAQITEAQAPEIAAKEEQAATAERAKKLHATVAEAMEGGAIAQNVKVASQILGDVQSLPDAIDRFLDIRDQADQRKGKNVGKLTAAEKKIGSALGITDSDGRPLNIDAEISTLTQQLTAAQTPQARQQITNQIDRLDLLRPIIAEAEARRAAPAAEAAPTPQEEMLPPIARAAEAAPAAQPEVTPAMRAAQDSGITARNQPNFIRGFEAAMNEEAAPTRGVAKQGFAAGQEYLKTQTPAAATTETPSAIQEPSPAGLYVQPAPEIGGAVGERNAQGGEAAGARIEGAPEVKGEVTTAPEEKIAPVTPAPEAPPAPPPAPASPAAQTFMQQQGMKMLSPEERAAARERQKAEEAAYLAKRQTQIQKAYAQNAQRGGVTAAPAAPKGMSVEDFMARRARERMISAPATPEGLAAEPSQLDNDVLSLVENQASGKQVLDFLAENSPNDITRMYAKHFTRLGVMPRIQMADVNDPELQLDREAAADRRIYGSYNIETDRVNLYERANAAQIVMHEATHAATIKGMATNTPAAKKVTEVFNDFKSRPEKYQGATPAYDDAEEFVSEAFSNPQFQEFLKSQTSGNRTLWDKFKDAVFKLLRLPQSARSMFDDVIDLGNQLFAESAAVPREEALTALEEAQRGGVESPMSINKSAEKSMQTLTKALDRFNRVSSLETATRKMALGWQSITHMVARYGDLFTSSQNGKKTNWLQYYADSQQQRSAISARMSQLFTNVYDDWQKLNTATAENLGKLMRLTEFNIDPRKSWQEQTWLHELPNSTQLKSLLDQGRQTWNRLDPKTRDLYERFEAVNNVDRYAQLSMSIYNMVKADPVLTTGIAGADVNPVDKFMSKSALHEDPREAQAYWKGELEKQITAADPFIMKQRAIRKSWEKYGARDYTKEQKDTADSIIKSLGGLVTNAKATMSAMEQSPNFHLGRFGDYMVTFTVRKQDGKADPDALERVAMALDQLGIQAQISPETTRSTVFMTLENEEQTEKVRQLAESMRERGWLDPDSDIKAGRRKEHDFVGAISPQWLEQFIASINETSGFKEEDDMDPAERAEVRKNRDKMTSRARELYLNMLPDNALAKVLTHRKSVPGYSPDMIRSFAFRHQISANTIANLATQPRTSEALREMRGIIESAKTGPVHKTVQLQNILSEVTQREVERPMRPQNSFWDSVRAFNHAYFLGFSPSYVLVNMTQPGVLLWPELAKQHGFVKSATAMANATPIAFKIMSAVMANKSADAIITEKSLDAAGLSPELAEFVMRVANTGNLDLGSSSRELGRVVEGETDHMYNRSLRWAAAAGYYSETLTRLIAALSARDLYKNKSDTEGLMAYTNKTINESMLNYSTWNTARQTGKMGIAGEYTPVMFSFMTYQFQVLEKMYRELRDAFGGSKEARNFLVGHLTALTLTAGTLGLPFASVAARALDSLREAFGDDDEPKDSKSDWRNFLAEIFGKDFAEVLARGVPRALGGDISSRAGEADLLPFSRLLTDRREWEDAAKDQALRTLGSPVSMMLNILRGGEQMAKGDVIGGLKTIVPNALKGPLEAYRMATDGRYVDNRGRELPLTPGASDILTQLLGITPAEKAEYQEASMAQTVRQGLLTREASAIRNQLADAIIEQSPDRAELMKQAQEYDRAHPDRPSIVKSISGVVRRRREGLETARAIEAPVGVKPKDIRGRALTGYMNVDMQ